MIKIKYERYWNDFIRKNEEKTFADLDALADWIFGQMQQDYTKDSLIMSFPTPETVKRIKANGPYRIEFKPRRGEESLWIYQIENSDGIIFSDGKFTSGQKHWSSEVQAWLTACEKRRICPTFNFVDEQPATSASDKDAQHTFTVTEMCPHCETEVEMRWNTATMGFKAFCPVCGERLMLCDECRHADCVPCDYDSQSDTCRFDKSSKEPFAGSIPRMGPRCPELAMYDEDNQTDLDRVPDDVPGDELGRYEIIFEADGRRFYCFVDAVNMNEALGQFFCKHPNITYSNVFEHIEV